jgi:hypothetical protein
MRKRGYLLAFATMTVSQPALACSMVSAPMTRAQVERHAREKFAAASAVVDAEVETPMLFGPAWQPGLMPAAVLRVIKRYKGKFQFEGLDIVQLVYAEGCDIALDRKGERIRILLNEGPGAFRALQIANRPVAARETAQVEFNAEIDRLVGSPRPTDYAAFPGEIPRPGSEAKSTSADKVRVEARPAAVKKTIPPSNWYGLGLLIALFLGGLVLRQQARS